jgi:transcriptional/translational regulatory protein YebC/TACO1
MYRDEAVKLMSDTIDEFNRYQAVQNSVPSDQIEEYIKQGRQQMDFINGMLYDVLKQNGVIL